MILADEVDAFAEKPCYRKEYSYRGNDNGTKCNSKLFMLGRCSRFIGFSGTLNTQAGYLIGACLPDDYLLLDCNTEQRAELPFDAVNKYSRDGYKNLVKDHVRREYGNGKSVIVLDKHL